MEFHMGVVNGLREQAGAGVELSVNTQHLGGFTRAGGGG
jgi:hypothetical protein